MSAPDNNALAGTLAVDLYFLLSDLDPDTWRRDRAPALRKRLSEIRERFRGMLEGQVSSTDGLSPRLGEVVAVIEAHLDETPEVEHRSRWMRLRRQLSTAYAGLAIYLRDHAIPLPEHRPSNYARNSFHVSSAAVAIVAAAFWPEATVFIMLPVVVVFWSLEAIRPFSRRVNQRLMGFFQYIVHPHEAHRINSATWYATSLLLLAWAMPPVVGAGAVAVLGLGDPAAGYFGRRFGRRKLIHGRTLEGTTAFALVGFLSCLLVTTGLFGLAWPTALVGAAAAGVAGAMGELLCGRKLDDNFVVPMLAAAALYGVVQGLG